MPSRRPTRAPPPPRATPRPPPSDPGRVDTPADLVKRAAAALESADAAYHGGAVESPLSDGAYDALKAAAVAAGVVESKVVRRG